MRRSRLDACDKRVRNLNLGSEADVDGEIGCSATGHGELLVGKNEDEMSPPTIVNISQSGPSLG